MDLRDLRKWHWKRAMAARTRENDALLAAERWEKRNPHQNARHYRNKATQKKGLADFHMRAVNALNTVVTGDVLDDIKKEQA